MMRQPPPARPPMAAPAELIARADLSSAAKVAWMGLAQFVGADGMARPRLAELQQVVGMADKTLRRALAELVERSLISAVRMTGGVTAFAFTAHNPGQYDRTTPVKMTGPQDGDPGQNDRTPPSHDFENAGEFSGVTGVSRARARVSSSSTEKIDSSPTPDGDGRGGVGENRRAAKPTRIPPDFVPSKRVLEYAARHCAGVDVSRELARFTAYWLAKGTIRKDWDLSFMRWLDRASPVVAAAPASGAGGVAASRRPLSGAMQHLLSIVENENG